MRRLTAAILLSATTAACAADAGPEYRVPVCVENRMDLAERITMDQAELLASKILHRLHVRLRWSDPGQRCPVEDDPILLRISMQTPGNYLSGAMGASHPFGGVHIQVFYDRLKQAANPPAMLPTLAGYALAHEITHVLEQSDAHSTTGVMKRYWSGQDFQLMQMQLIDFTIQDRFLVLQGLKARRSVLAQRRQSATAENWTQ